MNQASQMNRLSTTIKALVIFCIIALPVLASAQVSETGIASYYHNKFVGRKTANGEIFDQGKMTAAHKNLPLGTWVKVTNLGNDSTVIVRINDRMPQWNKRSIDLTKSAAGKLDYLDNGLTKVLIEVIEDPTAINQPIEREPVAMNYMAMINVRSLSKEAGVAIYPKLPIIQYLTIEKPKGGLFNSQR